MKIFAPELLHLLCSSPALAVWPCGRLLAKSYGRRITGTQKVWNSIPYGWGFILEKTGMGVEKGKHQVREAGERAEARPSFCNISPACALKGAAFARAESHKCTIYRHFVYALWCALHRIRLARQLTNHPPLLPVLLHLLLWANLSLLHFRVKKSSLRSDLEWDLKTQADQVQLVQVQPIFFPDERRVGMHRLLKSVF